MKYVQPAMHQSLITHSSITPSPVAALQQFGHSVNLLARPRSSHRQTSLWRESPGGAR
ncbi:hypothetical protein [Fischerella thermalis]|uniref:hypothetical protein n=1 Tax=Fischerella thermalis TaxID=372787 RepID=UPI0015E10CEB|nr:hypothetical protein [Fischerella thermalis]